MKKISIYTCIALSLIFANRTSAQQQAIFSNYLLNPFYYNPAISGSVWAKANLNYRSQWSGFEGAPKTFSGSVYGSINGKQKHGFGTMLVSDITGLTGRSGFYANYSYHFKVTKKSRLGFGITPGLVQYRIRLYDARLADGGDDLLTGNVLNQNALDLNAGFHWYGDDFFLAGSFHQILGEQTPILNYNEQLRGHINLMGAYTFHLNEKWDLQPSVLTRYNKTVPIQSDFTLRTTFQKTLFLSATYRTQDAASIGMGYILKNRLTIAYSYDYAFSTIKSYNSGSHEVALVYVIKAKRKTLDEKDEELNNSIMEQNKKKKENDEL